MGVYTEGENKKVAQSWTVTATITKSTGAIKLAKIVPGGSVTAVPDSDSYVDNGDAINIVTTIVSSEISNISNT